MHLKGEAHWILRDAKTLKIIDEGVEQNIITKFALEVVTLEDDLFISTSDNDFDYFSRLIPEADVSGTTIPGLPNIEGPFTTVPTYAKWQQRFPAPVEDRTIRVIGIGSNSLFANDADFKIKSIPRTILKLTTPIIQTTTTIVDIFYRLQFLDTGNISNQYVTNYIASTYVPGNTDPNDFKIISPTYLNPTWHPNAINIYNNSDVDFLFSDTSFTTQVSSLLFSATNRKYTYEASSSITSDTGSIYTHVLYSDSNSINSPSVLPKKVNSISDSIIQAVNGHSSNAINPFYNAVTNPIGQGTITFDDSSWIDPNDFAKIFRIDITSTGATGVATYKYREKIFFGANGNPNQFYEPYKNIPNIYGLISHRTGNLTNNESVTDLGSIASRFGCFLAPYNNDGKTVLVVTNTGLIWRINIFTGTRERWGNNGSYSTDNGLPAAVVNSISQIEVDTTGNIWIASESEGLYRISADGLTVDFFDATMFGGTPVLTNNCYGVDIGNGKIWAAFNGGLAYTTDNGASWTTIDDTTSPSFVQAAINADWSKIAFIRADRNSATDDIAIVANTSGTEAVVLWWSLTTPTVTQVTTPISINIATGDPYFFNANKPGELLATRALQVSSNSEWVMSTYSPFELYFLSHGNITPTLFSSDNNLVRGASRGMMFFVTDPTGANALLLFDESSRPFLAYPNLTYTSVDSFAQNALGNISEQGVYIGEGKVVLFDGSTINNKYPNTNPIDRLGNESILQFYIHNVGLYGDSLGGEVGEALSWKTYGWNGVSWELNNPNSKTTHVGAELLQDGITVSFNDNGGQFTSTDYYTAIACDGVVKDGSTEFSTTSDVYVGVDVEEITTFEVGTVQLNDNIGYIIGNPARNYSLDYLQGWVDQSGISTQASGYLYINVGTTEPAFPVDIDGIARSSSSFSGDFTIQFRYDKYSSISDRGAILVGIIDPVIIGQSHVDDTHITHGFFIDYRTGSPQIHIRENGTNIYTLPNTISSNVPDSNLNEFVIMRKGNEITYWYQGQLIYTSLVTSTGIKHLEVLLTGKCGFLFQNNDVYNYNDRRKFGYCINGYFTRVGESGNSTGAFDPLFDKLDNTKVDILLNGVPAIITATDNLDVALNAGEIAIFPETGVIKFSAADVGKTITGSALCLKQKL